MISQEQIFKARILIIDDQKLHVLLLEKILKAAGYKNILTLTDSRQAMYVLDDYKPDILLLDLKMPYVDGFEIMQQVNQKQKEERLPILLISAEKSQEVRLKALKEGASDILAKPYESAEVLMRIRNLVEIHFLNLQIRGQNRILEARVKERTKELHDTRLDIIHRLARTAEYRDNDTGLHIIRMGKLCARLGAAAGFSESQCELLLAASPLHDIGKIAIPDSILLKPGKLTPEEFEIMKTHTTIGAELLSGSKSPLMKMAEGIALTHHEKWDGTGYPRRLKGGSIPLAGRICCVCDVYDALSSRRPYKEPWTQEQVVAEIKKGSGSHFDANLVKCFLDILPDIQKIANTHLD